jgi:endonuclease YncB( thermonuclease family)
MLKLILALLLPTAAIAGELTCEVRQVHAADTFSCQETGQAPRQVKLAAIKALDPATPAGQLGREYLEKRLLGKTVVLSQDQQRPMPQRVWLLLDGKEINRELLNQGMARVHPEVSEAEYYMQQNLAIRAGLGLWHPRYDAETGSLAR